MNPDVFITIVFAGIVAIVSLVGALAVVHSARAEQEQTKRPSDR